LPSRPCSRFRRVSPPRSKGLRVGTLLAEFSDDVGEALYRGRVSVVTYVVASGLVLVGGFLGVLGTSSLDPEVATEPVLFVQFVHAAIPWLAGGALVASAGRLLDGRLRGEDLGASVNLPFVAIGVGLAVRGFTAYVLQVSDAADPLQVPAVSVGTWEMEGFAVTPGTHLTIFILASIVVSLVGVRVASYVSSPASGPLDRRI
jgi:putative membrane protein